VSEYQNSYEADFFGTLSNVIKEAADAPQAGRHKIKDQHKSRCDDIAQQVHIAKMVALKECMELTNDSAGTVLNNTIEGVAKKDEYKDENIQKAFAKLKAAEQLENMFRSLAVLSKRNNCYNEDTLNKHLGKLDNLKMLKCEAGDIESLKSAIEAAENTQLFKHHSSSTKYDSTCTESDGGKKGRFSVEHKNNGNTVIINYDLDRKALLGQSMFSSSAGRESAYQNLKEQTKDAVLISIAEHDKGSKTNPINIQPATNKKGEKIPQADVGLALLLEFKEQAILQGKTFYVKHGGKPVEITPKEGFGDLEMAMFAKYAMDKAAVSTTSKETYGGSTILRHSTVDNIENDSDCKDKEKVQKAIKGYVSGNIMPKLDDRDKETLQKKPSSKQAAGRF